MDPSRDGQVVTFPPYDVAILRVKERSFTGPGLGGTGSLHRVGFVAVFFRGPRTIEHQIG